MDSGRTSGTAKVQDALAVLGMDCPVKELGDSTRTAVDAANALGCDVGQIVKSLVFRGRKSGNPIFVVVSGANRVSEKALAALVGERMGPADADFVHRQTGYPVGGVAPVGHPQPLPTFIDEDLLQYEELWAGAGTSHAMFSLTPDQLCRMTAGQVAAIKKVDQKRFSLFLSLRCSGSCFISFPSSCLGTQWPPKAPAL